MLKKILVFFVRWIFLEIKRTYFHHFFSRMKGEVTDILSDVAKGAWNKAAILIVNKADSSDKRNVNKDEVENK